MGVLVSGKPGCTLVVIVNDLHRHTHVAGLLLLLVHILTEGVCRRDTADSQPVRLIQLSNRLGIVSGEGAYWQFWQTGLQRGHDAMMHPMNVDLLAMAHGLCTFQSQDHLEV